MHATGNSVAPTMKHPSENKPQEALAPSIGRGAWSSARVQAEARARFRELLGRGWRDAIRTAASRRADVHLLVLLAEPLATRCRAAHRSSTGEQGGREAVRCRRRRSRGAEQRKRQRSCRRPLLAIDGNSFAHRAYHALPKTIRRKGNRPAGAILGFANLLLRLYRDETPRAVVVAWDTLEEETYRHEAFPAYQSGREFDDDIVEQLAVIPEFVTACGFSNARRARLRG